MKKNNIRKNKNIIKCNRLSSLELSKLCLTVEAKIKTLSDDIFNLYRENILHHYKWVSGSEPTTGF